MKRASILLFVIVCVCVVTGCLEDAALPQAAAREEDPDRTALVKELEDLTVAELIGRVDCFGTEAPIPPREAESLGDAVERTPEFLAWREDLLRYLYSLPLSRIIRITDCVMLEETLGV